jgi:acetylornithine deacetylase/succinyl-diaminopimelate desuccinylase-like protein
MAAVAACPANCALTGVQGHVAYPHLADNPITRLIAMLAPVNGTALDGGNDYFDPSTANVTSIDTGNEAGNVIPASVSAKFNIRFNTEHNSDDLIGWLEEHFNRVGGEWTATWRASAQPFVTPVGSFTALMQTAIESVTWTKASSVNKRWHIGCALYHKYLSLLPNLALLVKPCIRSMSMLTLLTSTSLRKSIMKCWFVFLRVTLKWHLCPIYHHQACSP